METGGEQCYSILYGDWWRFIQTRVSLQPDDQLSYNLCDYDVYLKLLQLGTPHPPHTLRHTGQWIIRCQRCVVCLCTDWPLARVKAMVGEPGMYQGQLPFTFSLTYSYLLAAQEKIRFQSVCMLLSDVSVVLFFFNFVQCFAMGNHLGRYQLRKLQWYHICLWQTHWAVFGVPLPFNINQLTPYSFLLSFHEKTTLLPQQVAGYWALLNSSQMSHQELHS